MDREKEYEEALIDVLKNEFPKAHYSVGGYSEDAVCMEKTDTSQWIVYYGFRNQDESKKVYESFIDAGIDMIQRLGGVDAANTPMIIDSFIDITKSITCK